MIIVIALILILLYFNSLELNFGMGSFQLLNVFL